MDIDRQHSHRDRGWALASVLWAVAMLSLMAAATQELTLTAHRSERRAWDRARADAVLDSGITEAVMGITAPNLNDRWRVDGSSRDVVLDGLNAKITVQDELGRYDLNAMDGSVLTTLLRSAGVDTDAATGLTDSILDWRSPPGPHRLNAAADGDYAAAGRPYRPRRAPFQSVEELQLVLGMTKPLFEAIRPALTVYTKRGTVDPAFATRMALLALYHGDPAQVDTAMKARAEVVDPASPVHARNGILNMAGSVVGQTLEIAEEIQIGSRLYRRGAVIELTDDDKHPYFLLAWR